MEISYQNIWLKNQQPMKKEDLPPDYIERGVSLYEVLRVMQGVPLFLEQHLERLKNSAQLTNMSMPFNDDEISRQLQELINLNQIKEGNIKLVVNSPVKSKPADFYVYFTKHAYPSPEDYRRGVKTVLVETERVNPNAKVDRADYRGTIDAAKRDTGSYEALLVDRQGMVSEGGRSNLFMVKGEVVYTAPADKVLKGITRQMVLAVCKKQGYQVIEKEISREEMLNMDAIFLSSTSPKVLPIRQVDDIIINSVSNDIIQGIMAGYDTIIAEYIKTHRS